MSDECTLPKEINECPFYNSKFSICSNEKDCSFKGKEEKKEPKYVRKERWYEKYYKK